MQAVVSLIDVSAAKKLTDEYIHDFCSRRSGEALELGPAYSRLWQSIEKLLLAGGKRFRPYMVLATYQVYQPKNDLKAILPAAVAQELIHSAMLVHDDIIDRDMIRYGVKNIAGQYDEYYQPYLQDTDERNHMTLSAALLAGDALLADAHKVLRKTNRASELVDQAEDILNTSIFEVIGGELLDSEIAFLPEGAITAEVISRYKTASYSFVGPLTTGAVLAEAPETDINILKEFAIIVGIGYQFRDDILGMFGDTKLTGKSTTTDIKEGKRTYLIEQFETVANDTQKELFFSIFHQPEASDQEIETAKNILIESGALQSVEDRIEQLRQQAFEKISQLSLSEDGKSMYEGLVNHCLKREV